MAVMCEEKDVRTLDSGPSNKGLYLLYMYANSNLNPK
jgi:hypothetical protein